MKCNVFMGIIFGLNIGLFCSLSLYFHDNYIYNIPIENIDTVVPNIITDTIYYESIDTTVIVYPWGREEIYYFKYKEN